LIGNKSDNFEKHACDAKSYHIGSSLGFGTEPQFWWYCVLSSGIPSLPNHFTQLPLLNAHSFITGHQHKRRHLKGQRGSAGTVHEDHHTQCTERDRNVSLTDPVK